MGVVAAAPQVAAKQTGKAHPPARASSPTRRLTAAATVPEILDSPGQPLDVGLARELQARFGLISRGSGSTPTSMPLS